MENRFKLRISRMFRSSFGSCRTRKISDVIEKPIFTPQNHKNTVPLFDPSPSPPPKPKPFPSICKPRRSESTQTAVNHDCVMVTHKETIPRRRKTNTARCYYPPFVSSAVTGGYHHPMSPLNFFSDCKDFGFYEKKKTVTRHKTKTKKKKRVYHVHHKTNNNTTPFFFSSSSRESASYGGPWWWLSSEEDETETLFSSMNLSSDSSESISARRIRPRSNRKNCNNPRRRKAKNSSCDNDNNNKVKDSFAVVKRSSDPYNDFRTSMVEMIVERQIFAAEDLEQLLQCFLSLNSHHHHGIIVEVFTEICETLFSNWS
ncbi:hypothetical protein Gogos_015956 [Gossypium gossypioides]|uniref:Transcription repressor n=1 Tax=Gossypium gossypioides TaxID=34282 RepID=A0A7J9B6D4_GOSGO|nr:hypothetical protein [Gossypium gossypioides]